MDGKGGLCAIYYIPAMPNNTAQLFDNMFKSIIKDASPSALVHLINGIYKKSYPLDTQVSIAPTEFIKENPKSGKLEKHISDIVLTLHIGNRKDTFLMEAQISDDLDMVLRVFNYSTLIALDNKVFSEDGSCMEIEMPSPAVIYWETSKAKDVSSIRIKFPNGKTVNYEIPAFKVLQHKVSELGNMALLLPFYILKIRKELERKSTDSAKRKELSKRLEGYILDIDKTLRKLKQKSYISDKDAAMLLKRLHSMYSELYGSYEEFTEVDMTIEQLVHTGIDEMLDEAIAKAEERVERRYQKLMHTGIDEAIDKAVAKAEIKAEKRGVKQGISQTLSHTAKAMKAGGEAIDKIMRYTGLSRREIAAL